MRGPRFLSLVAKDEFVFCGGAHPDNFTLALVFDLSSGEQVRWIDKLPPESGARGDLETQWGGGAIPTLRWRQLDELAMKTASEECKPVYQDSWAYQLWPDACKNVFLIEASNLPHVRRACAVENEVTIGPALARRLGFEEALVSALEDAHRRLAHNRPSPKLDR